MTLALVLALMLGLLCIGHAVVTWCARQVADDRPAPSTGRPNPSRREER